MRNSLFLISLALSSAACSSEVVEQPVTQPHARASATAPASGDEGGGQALSFESNEEKQGGRRSFAYSWPAEAGAQPDLAAQLDAEREAALAIQKEEWEQSLVDSPEDCVSCRGQGYEKEWKVVADLPEWLSLSADIYVYTGGAHGNYTRQSLVWNKAAGAALSGADLFTSPVALETALGAKLCDALDAERAERRGGPVERDGEWSTDCPGIDEASVLVGSSNGETFDRIGVYYSPYTAGSYAEGAYELNFPVTASVIDAVKPEYARAFSVKR